eukprot:Phypoly_transcript_03436.p1 GENE.Phypoly_transcript_03436~~Phypoly_transcript_03436.p1  ORF type:complete len:687 (+),score=66.03 Phypoly_transcript_03436:188-2248(+)
MPKYLLSFICFAVLLFQDFGWAESGVANVTVYWGGGGPLCNCTNGGEFTDTFACNYGDRGNWSDGLQNFLDPTPPNSIITNITAILYGTIACDVFSPGPQVFLKIGPTVFASKELTPNLPCFCANCVQSETVLSSTDFSCGVPGYLHGAINPFQIIVEENSLCLSRIELYFNYTVAAPFYGTLTPTFGPSDGNTMITVQGYDTKNSDDGDLECVFNSTSAPAQVVKTETDTVQCISPPSGGMFGFVPFYVTTTSACPGMQPVSNSTVFEYYIPPNFSSVAPTRGPTKGGTLVTIDGSSFFNTSQLSCRVGIKAGNATFVNSSQILCIVPPATGVDLSVQISFNGQNYHSSNFNFTYAAPKTFWTSSMTSWIILSISGVAALGLILLFIGLIKSKFKKDGYSKIVEGKQITIDEVRLGPRIGKGNFGEVYKAYWRGAEIAVKKLPAHNMTDQFLKDFHKEVSLMRALRHPNVIQFLGSCTVLPDICICTEYMPRGSLYKILHDPSQSLNWALIKKMCVDAAKGCVYLHDCTPTIVHRDLKSHNLLVDENWKVKVCDFGLSTIVEQQSRTMTACGTPCWTAPEVLRNQRYTEKADVYSFGIVLWECATRDDPFVGMPPFQVIFAVGREGLRPPLPRVCPNEFAKLITDCWDEKATTRPSMKEVLARLEDIDTTGWPDIPRSNNPSPLV